MQVKTDQYIFPPRAAEAIPREHTDFLADLGWIAQLKYNDSRCNIKYCDNDIELWNRHAEKFRSYHCPDHLKQELRMIGERLGVKPGTITILDGGLLDQKHSLVKDTIVLWDILALNNEHLIGTTYGERYDRLHKITNGTWTHEVPTMGPVEFGLKLTKSVFVPESYTHEYWDELWDLVYKVNAPYTIGTPNSANYEIKPILEGLVLKDEQGKLEFGFREKNNDSWLCRSRIQTGRHRF